MRIAAISDLHIGAHGPSDPFRHREDDFLRWLDAVEATHDHVVLLGDVWQCDHALRTGPTAEADQLAAARARLPRLTARFDGPGYHLVAGNHDAVAATALGARDRALFEADGFRALFVHGHQLDPVIGAAPRVSAAATWFAGRVRAAGLRAVAERLEDQDVTVKHRRFCGPDGPYVQGALALLAEAGAQAVVLGHTHMPEWHTVPAGIVANTGTCSRGRFMGVSVDTAARAVGPLAVTASA